MSVFTHIVVGTNHVPNARSFYDAVLRPLGLIRLGDLEERGSFWGIKTPAFFITRPRDGKSATVANGGTIGLSAPSRSAVDAFHDAALINGGKSEGVPGPRDFAPGLYAAYIRDPDGNKLCAYCYASD